MGPNTEQLFPEETVADVKDPAVSSTGRSRESSKAKMTVGLQSSVTEINTMAQGHGSMI